MSDDIIDLTSPHRKAKGRGTDSIVKSRFESIQIEYLDDDEQQIKTQVFKDTSRTIIAKNDSPDVGFNATLNPYRGCEHGCVYCYARPTHEYLGLSSGLDFETKIFAKLDAPELLLKTLGSRSYTPEVLGMSGVTDCYQPIERQLKITRGCLEILSATNHPVVVITKNYLVTRDLDIFKKLALFNAVHIVLSITTLDEELARRMEPRASTPARRLLAIKELSAAGIPVSVNMAPLIPGLTDHEIPNILATAKQHGAFSAHYAMLRLPHGVKDQFVAWLDRYYPLRKNKVVHRLLEMRDGKLYHAQFGSRMVGAGPYAEHLAKMFSHYRQLYELNRSKKLSVENFCAPSTNSQLSLF